MSEAGYSHTVELVVHRWVVQPKPGWKFLERRTIKVRVTPKRIAANWRTFDRQGRCVGRVNTWSQYRYSLDITTLKADEGTP